MRKEKPTMYVTNQTNQILVFGRTTIFPQATGLLPSEFDEHETVDLLIRLRKLSPASPVTPVRLSPVQEMFTPPTKPADPTPVVFEEDDEIPVGWDEIHANKAYAWIKKQDNVVLLSKMAAIEDRPKVQAKLELRVAELQGE